MAGRRRRASTSSVETLDGADVSYLTEADAVLAPKSQKSDYWPCYMLRDAVVYHQDEHGKPETDWMGNLLQVTYDGPFVVRGKLDVENDETACVFSACANIVSPS